VVPGPRDCPVGTPYCRCSQCFGRLPESLALCSPYRVDCPERLSGSCVASVAQTNDRSVRHQIQSPSPGVRLPSAGPGSLGGGRVVSTLGGHDHLRVSSVPPVTQGDTEGEGGQGPDDSDCALVALSALVPGSQSALPGSSIGAGSPPRPSGSTPVGHSASEPGTVAPSRVVDCLTRQEVVKQSVQAAGASAAVADLVANARRPQTERLYNHKWALWSQWCAAREVVSTNPSAVQLAEFLAWLANEKHLSVSTVRGYRSAISLTIRQLGGRSFSDDPLLHDVVRGLALQQVSTRRAVPAWDLFLVLNVLKSAPFEPLSDITFKALSFKTAFLLALATARRRSEIHGLSGNKQDISFEPDGSVALRFLPEFLAKNQPVGSASPLVIVQSLSRKLDRQDKDRNLCPVRCLSFYLARSEPRRRGQRRLLVSLNEQRVQDIAAGTVSRWISETVSWAYQLSNASLGPLHPRAHEVRALATSAAFHQSWPLSQILEAAYWRGSNTFSSHYLRDLRSERADGAFGVSFVAARAVLQSSTAACH
jgi:hypothetical protein